jgi:hypothetical protein
LTEHHRPPACHYDRHLGERVTTEHRDDCPDPIGHRGCKPCTAPHCAVCGRAHLDNSHPQTCPTCIGKVRRDLDDLTTAYDELAIEAIEGGADGRLVAAAPIPGGTAQVLRGPTVGYQDLRYSRTMRDDHPISTRTGLPVDPIPPLAVLVEWEDRYRAWLGHDPHARASLHGAVAYLRDQLPTISQLHAGPDWQAFTDTIRDLRAHLEAALHDERAPERGVECFECGDNLVRRWHAPARCTHSTPARRELRRWLQLGYPEALTRVDARAARRPCGNCDQGGIGNPSAGQSWECRGCRKEYDPGEYATAVRRDLLTGGPANDGWTHIAMAAEAVTMMTGVTFGAARIRRWMDRGQVASRWSEGTTGLRLVLWTDVRDRAAEAIRRAKELEIERRHEAAQEQQLREAVARGRKPEVAGKRLGIHPARVAKFVEKWDAEARQAAREERRHRAG